MMSQAAICTARLHFQSRGCEFANYRGGGMSHEADGGRGAAIRPAFIHLRIVIVETSFAFARPIMAAHFHGSFGAALRTSRAGQRAPGPNSLAASGHRWSMQQPPQPLQGEPWGGLVSMDRTHGGQDRWCSAPLRSGLRLRRSLGFAACSHRPQWRGRSNGEALQQRR